MPHLNVEIKARTSRIDAIRAILMERKADFRGTDHQEDTYFHCQSGRMKLREGNVEHSLIHYDRPDQEGPKDSIVHLYRPQHDPALKEVLVHALGVWKVVKKAREIYFIDNVKFHIDQVDGLGEFVEIEAIDAKGDLGQKHLLAQCEAYMALFQIKEEDLLSGSYSDMV